MTQKIKKSNRCTINIIVRLIFSLWLQHIINNLKSIRRGKEGGMTATKRPESERFLDCPQLKCKLKSKKWKVVSHIARIAFSKSCTQREETLRRKNWNAVIFSTEHTVKIKIKKKLQTLSSLLPPLIKNLETHFYQKWRCLLTWPRKHLLLLKMSQEFLFDSL